jgi:hypothetical protein
MRSHARFLAIAATLFAGLAGCSRGSHSTAAGPAASTSTAPTMEALVSTPSKLTFDQQLLGPCPQQWTCQDLQWYSNQATCQANCSSTCFQDFHCMLGCVCP